MQRAIWPSCRSGGGGEVGGLGVGELNASMGRRGGFGAVG